MVHVENLFYGICLQVEPLSHQLPLEVAHAVQSLFHAVVEHVERLVLQTIDSSRDEMVVGFLCVVEARDVQMAVCAHP